MIKEELLKNAKKLHLNTDVDVLNKLEQEWHLMEREIEKLKSVDVSNVKPMAYPVNKKISFLRKDVPSFKVEKKTILTNAPQSDEDFVLIHKVVKND